MDNLAELGAQNEADDLVAAYRRNGYVVVRGVFAPSEVAGIAAAAEQEYAEGIRHGRSFRHGNLFYNVAPDGNGQPLVRMVQWPSYHRDRLNGVRLDPRIARLLAPLIGRDLKQIINQLHWKCGGGLSDFAWHQDCRFRKPASAYRNLADAFVQTGLALDPHTPDSGCMRVVPGSHLRGDLDIDTAATVLANPLSDDALIACGLLPEDVVDLVLAPGDLAMWSPYLVHGSGDNRAKHRRRLYINGYVRAGDCDRGEWAFRDGAPVPFGAQPALVHYEQLHSRGEPHYV